MRIFFALLFVFLLSSCGHNDNKITFYNNNTLSGIYTSCGGTSAGYEKTLLTFSGNSFTTATAVYAETNCEGNLLSSTSGYGTYTASGNNVDYTFSDGTIVYDIFKQSGEFLLVGDRSGSLNGTDPSLRPRSYSSAIIFYILKKEHPDYYYWKQFISNN